MTDRPPSAGPLADQVYRDLLHAIRIGDYAERTRLPSETEMSVRFGVSRPVLRQALERLRAEGVIHATRGSGNFVTKTPEDAFGFAPLQSIADVQRCLEFRRVLESEAAAAAARRRTSENLALIEAAVGRFEDEVVAGEDGLEADFEFHLAIAQAANNQYFLQTFKALREQVLFSINLIRSLSRTASATRTGQVAGEHRRILEAIRTGDSDAARRAVADHIQAGIDRLFS